MVNCKNCGEEVKDGAKFCQNCGSEVIVEEEDLTGTKFCSKCGFEMPKATKFCPECGAATNQAPAVTRIRTVQTEKSPALAAILSFLIVGLGQVYLGLNKRGIILFLAAVVSVILMFVLVGFLLWLIVWGYAIYDAFNTADKMNMGIEVEDTLDFNNLL